MISLRKFTSLIFRPPVVFLVILSAALLGLFLGYSKGIEAQARREVMVATVNHRIARKQENPELAAYFETVILWNMQVWLKSEVKSDDYYHIDWLPDGAVQPSEYTRSKESASWHELRKIFQERYGPLDSHLLRDQN